MELSRPTVSGRTACGKRTVSRTGKTGILLVPENDPFWGFSGGNMEG
jgi:hypothetical protein